MPHLSSKLDKFLFRDLLPNLSIGTASDRYAGWIGQVYSADRYENRITRRTKKVGAKSFTEEVLPIDSVEEYFHHFNVVELDFTFYRPLMDNDNKPTQVFHTLRTYRQYLKEDDRIILKTPQAFFAKKVRSKTGYVQNQHYLDPKAFVSRFYQPAMDLLGPWIAGFIFEQEYQRKEERPEPKDLAAGLDDFFSSIPNDGQYHVELRTEAFLTEPVFNVFERHGIGQVLSNWTWLPALARQFGLSGNRIFNDQRACIIRLMTPQGIRYEDAYARAHPFNALVDGMHDQQAIKKTAEIVKTALDMDAKVNLIINNRYGGNAPLSAQHMARQFLGMNVDD